MAQFRSIAAALRAIERDSKKLERRMQVAAKKGARSGASIVRQNMPRAFGELRDAVDVEDADKGSRIVADAPYAAAVEFGSRPHTPPLAPLIAWVKLRGMQGLGNTSKLRGPTSNRHAKNVAQQLALEVHQYGSRKGSTDIDAPEKIARAIQRAISINGTKPHFYMRKSVDPVGAQFWEFVLEELSKASRDID